MTDRNRPDRRLRGQPVPPADHRNPSPVPPHLVPIARWRSLSEPSQPPQPRSAPSTDPILNPIPSESLPKIPVAPVPATPPSKTPTALDWLKRRVRRGVSSWKVWVLLALLLCAGSGTFALAVLLRLPGTPNCPAIFWPLASAALRFECAQLAASKQTAKDLLEAIALLDSLPPDHPMRAEADRLIELWSEEVLRLADEAFNAGKLDEAIADARRIPSNVRAYRLVEERIQRWQSIWSKAEDLYRKSEAELRKLNWRQAFLLAVRLLDVENTFWQTIKYEELNKRITVAREDGDKLLKADRLADDGTLKGLLDAIKLAESISSKSYVYEAARKAIVKYGRVMLDMAQESLDRHDLQGALAILDKVPAVTNLKEDVKDLTALSQAQSASWQNTVAALEDAISQAQRIDANRPLYKKAQQLITRWQLEIEGVAQLEKAKSLAGAGSVADLSAAIVAASQVTKANPRWDEAQQQIETWTKQIQEIEDRPLLNQAEQFASRGDVAALQAAIAQASQIARGRTLHREAQNRIADWTARIERIQDQPYLDQARQLASAGNLSAAIDTAEQIKSGRSLYQEAQTDVRTWRKQLQTVAAAAQSQRSLEEAVQLASTATPDALAAAIQKADQVSGELRSQAEAAIANWSLQLLQLADTRANLDVAGAIAIAQKIPPRATTYAEAQQRIQSWKKLLAPTTQSR